MCDFHTRLVAATSKLPSVRSVRLMRRGTSGTCRLFRLHPHLSLTLVNDVTFPFPLRGRPKDHSRGYFLANLHAVRREVAKRCEAPAPDATTVPSPCKRSHKQRHLKTQSSAFRPSVTPPAPTRLSQDPFAVLTSLALRTAVT